MKIDIYKSAHCGDKYLSVAVGTKLNELELPASFDADLLALSPFKTRLDIDISREHPSIDHADVLQQIAENGYAVHGVKTVVTVGK